jgi:HD-like signal output (HDOD) protein
MSPFRASGATTVELGAWHGASRPIDRLAQASNPERPSSPAMPANANSHASPGSTRPFGNFSLRALLGKSAATMVWLAVDRRSQAEVMLTMPREPPPNAAALETWFDRTRRAARLDHPHLARVLEIGVQEHWPFIAVAREGCVTLQERLRAHADPAPTEAVAWLCDALQGLACAHDAGAWHGDPQLHHLLIDDRGRVSLMALGAADEPRPSAMAAEARGLRQLPADPLQLRDQRIAAERDVLCSAILLHQLLAGAPALGVADTLRVVQRLVPVGREILQLPWATPIPVAETLRVIVDRATASQQRLRYLGARTLHHALSGWLAAQAGHSGGPLAALLTKVQGAGHLPALPGLTARVTRIVSMEGHRTDDIAEEILPDLALSFELLRTLNSAQARGTQVTGNGTILALRRVVALIGVEGVRKAAAGLRSWPGSLTSDAAEPLKTAMNKARFAGHVAQALRPPGYDAEVVYLITVMQNLGRLLVRYHFADEAQQIEALMKPARRVAADGDTRTAELSGMSEDAAAVAVLGVESAALGLAVAAQWGLGEDVAHMIRRMPLNAAVPKPESDAALLRVVGSAANELVDAIGAPPPLQGASSLQRVVERYARALNLGLREVKEAMREAREALGKEGASGSPGWPPGEPAGSVAHVH